MPQEVNIEALNPNEDFEQHQSEVLAEAMQKQEEEMQAKEKEEEEHLTPAERVRRLLYSLIIDSNPLTSDELSFILT